MVDYLAVIYFLSISFLIAVSKCLLPMDVISVLFDYYLAGVGL